MPVPSALVLLRVLLFFAVLTLPLYAGPIVWDGPSISFSKPDYADPYLAENQDRLTDSVWLTRADSMGLFNIQQEEGFDYESGVSPSDTEWAYGLIADYASLDYSSWGDMSGWYPPSMVGQDAVLHLITDDVFLQVRFTSWTSGAIGGGFSYDRSTPGTVPEPATGAFMGAGFVALLMIRRRTR